MQCPTRHPGSRRRRGACRGRLTADIVLSNEPRFQPFPSFGRLFKRMNILRHDLLAKIAHEAGEVYAYVVRTAQLDPDDPSAVRQVGSAPNFQGGLLTLCTCKHSMRAGRKPENWPGTWVAGFSSGQGGQPQKLFYLMRVERAFISHYEMWNQLPPAVREAKSMRRSHLGDLCEPKSTLCDHDRPQVFDPSNYYPPRPDHSHANGWENDLDHSKQDKFNRPTALLMGDPERSYLWSRPILTVRGQPFTQGCCKFSTLGQFLQCIKELP
jgi:putative DNA base modification enzyme with NMAD domain